MEKSETAKIGVVVLGLSVFWLTSAQAQGTATCQVVIQTCPGSPSTMSPIITSVSNTLQNAGACLQSSDVYKNMCQTAQPVTATYTNSSSSFVQTAAGYTNTNTAPNLLYVDPISGNDSNSGTNINSAFLTIGRAQSAVRSLLSAKTPGNITVFLRGGFYFISSPLEFNHMDSGTGSQLVTYSAYFNGSAYESPIISGGKLVQGWSPSFKVGNNQVSVASVGSNRFRQLYMVQFDSSGRLLEGQTKLRRARTFSFTSSGAPSDVDFLLSEPNLSTWPGSLTVMAPSSTTGFASGASTAAIQATEIVMRKSFGISRLRVQSVAASSISGLSNITVNPADGELDYCESVQNITGCSITPGGGPFYYNLPAPSGGGFPAGTAVQPFHLENNIDFVAQPTDWFLDGTDGNVFLIPPSGVNLSTALVIAPIGSAATDDNVLVDVGGSGPNTCDAVTNLQFVGLTFSHSNWLQPNQGYIEFADPDYRTGTTEAAIPAAVQLNCATNVTFAHNSFSQLGGGGIGNYTLTNSTTSGLTNVTIYGNSFNQIAGGAMYLTDGAAQNLIVSSNLITQVGSDYGSGGILVWGSNNAEVVHNDIRFVSDLGIKLLMTADEQFAALNTAQFPLNISENRISNVTLDVSDAGGIYSANSNPQSNLSEPANASSNPLFTLFPTSTSFLSPKIEIDDNLINSIEPLTNDWMPSTGANTSLVSPRAVYLDTGSEGVDVIGNEFSNVPYSFKFNCETNDFIFSNQLDPNQVQLVLLPASGACSSVTSDANSSIPTSGSLENASSVTASFITPPGLYTEVQALWSSLLGQPQNSTSIGPN